MKNFYSFCLLAAALIAPGFAYAQSVESDIQPAPGLYQELQIPSSYTLSFSGTDIEVTKIIDNTNYTEIPPASSEPDASPLWEGLFGRVIVDGIESQPLEIVVNADNTATLNFSTSKVVYLSTMLQNESEGLWNFTVNLPEGLFTIEYNDDEGQPQSAKSQAMKFVYNHLGSWELTTPVCKPENETTVTSLKEITLDFPVEAQGSNVQWQCLRGSDTLPIYYKAKGEREWNSVGKVTVQNNLSNPHAQRLTVQGPALTDAGQYYIDMPFGTFRLTAEQAFDGTNIANFVNPLTTIRYAIGEEISDAVGKESFFVSSVPAEGPVNLIDVPSGVEFIKMVFNETPEINRELTAPVELWLDGATEPLRTVSPSDSEIFFVVTKGLSDNPYENETRIYVDRGQSNIDQRGDYTMKFPEGVFIFPSGEVNAAFELKWHIDATLEYRIYPEQEAKINELEQITVTFPNASKIEINEANEQPLYLKTPAGNITPDINISGKVVALNIENATADGLYTIFIPSGFFNVTVDNEILPNQIIEKIFDVSDVAIPQITPAQGILPSNKISEIKITLPEDSEIIGFLPNTSYNRLYPTTDAGEPDYSNRLAYFSVVDPDLSIGGNEFTMRSTSGRDIVLEPGNYIFITAAYLYTLFGGDQPGEGKYYWTVLPEYEVLAKPAINPAEGSTATINFFTITLPADQGNVSNVNNIMSYAYPVNADGTFGPAAATFMPTKGNGANEIDLVAINPVTNITNGKYALVTPKGLYRSGDKQADSYTFYFDYTGNSSVEGIEGVDNGLYTVYSLDGICIMRNVEAAALETLEKGFYIINGKKVCKR